MLASEYAHQQDARIAHEVATGLEHQLEIEVPRRVDERTTPLAYIEHRLVDAVGDAESAAQVQLPQLHAVLAQRIEQSSQASKAVEEGSGFDDLRADVTGQADQVQVGIRRRLARDLERLGHGDAELGLSQTGGEVGMGVRIDVGVDAQADLRAPSRRLRATRDPLELFDRLDVDRANVRRDGSIDLCVRLADARKDDLRGRNPRRQGALQLAARHDVRARPLARQQAQDGLRGVRLHRVAQLRRAARHRLGESSVASLDGGRGVGVGRCTDLGRDLMQRDAFHPQRIPFDAKSVVTCVLRQRLMIEHPCSVHALWSHFGRPTSTRGEPGNPLRRGRPETR